MAGHVRSVTPRRISRPPLPASAPFLRRLLRHRGGNTLVIMAASMIPMSALAGSAIDMARLYVVKSRLQQACDAGVLAGRKFMTSGTSTTLDSTAAARAQSFFASNFQSGWFDAASATFTPVKTSDQQVSGTAAVKVPMTIMKMFAAPDVTVSVACKARYDIADTDVVFVLDTTGSMACRPEDSDADCSSYVNANAAQKYTRPSSDSDATAGYLGTTSYAVPETTTGSGSRIKALRQAVKDFYSTVADNVDSDTRLRYGFVSYTSTVNAGKAIYSVNPAYLVGSTTGETAPYQSRKVTGEYQTKSETQTLSKSYSSCTNGAYTNKRTPSAALTFDTSTGTATYETQAWSGLSWFGSCTYTKQTVGPQYTYSQYNWDVSKYLTGVAVTDPTKVKGQTSRWDGCIEERQTEAGTTSFSSKSYDLDPELIPDSTAAKRWKPMWADAEYTRWGFSKTSDDTTNGDDDTSRYSYGDDDRNKSGYYSCGKPIHRLSTMTAAKIAAYVDATDFKPLGGTYHDTGMIWGVRLLADNGIFAADNAGRTGQPSPRKVIVFLTDGAMAPSQYLYGFYGVEYFDRRVSAGNFTSLTDYHNARFLYECRKAAALGIDVWTIAIGSGTTSQLTSCASNSAQALYTTSGSGLSSIFQQIARQVARLRLDQ